MEAWLSVREARRRIRINFFFSFKYKGIHLSQRRRESSQRGEEEKVGYIGICTGFFFSRRPVPFHMLVRVEVLQRCMDCCSCEHTETPWSFTIAPEAARTRLLSGAANFQEANAKLGARVFFPPSLPRIQIDEKYLTATTYLIGSTP